MIPTKEELEKIKLAAILEKEIDRYVYLREDDKGSYIEYAFKEGAPHDNRCLSWYYSLQPNAIKRNNESFGHPENTEKEIEWRKEKIEKHIGNIFYLNSFTCGHEENMERALEENKKHWEEYYPGEPFIPEDHMCRVGKPAPKCIKNCICSNWTKEEPVKCACWTLSEVKIPTKILIPIETALKLKDILLKDD